MWLYTGPGVHRCLAGMSEAGLRTTIKVYGFVQAYIVYI